MELYDKDSSTRDKKELRQEKRDIAELNKKYRDSRKGNRWSYREKAKEVKRAADGRKVLTSALVTLAIGFGILESIFYYQTPDKGIIHTIQIKYGQENKEENPIIFENNNIVIRYTGYTEGNLGAEIGLYIQNNSVSHSDIEITIENLKINGVKLGNTFKEELHSGDKIYQSIIISYDELEEKGISLQKIKEAEFTPKIIDLKSGDDLGYKEKNKLNKLKVNLRGY